jgi:hypothetical protein
MGTNFLKIKTSSEEVLTMYWDISEVFYKKIGVGVY